MRRFVSAAVVLLPALVLAQPAPRSDAPATRALHRVTHLDFQDELIEGGLGGPAVERVEARGPRARGSLLRVRESFAEKVVASVHDLD